MAKLNKLKNWVVSGFQKLLIEEEGRLRCICCDKKLKEEDIHSVVAVRRIFCSPRCYIMSMKQMRDTQLDSSVYQCLKPDCYKTRHKRDYSSEYYDYCGKGHADSHAREVEHLFFVPGATHQQHHYHQVSRRTNRGGGSGPILFYNKDQPYYEFTNFAYYPIFVDENLFQTSEHYFQSQKLVGTPYENHVSQLPTPRDAFEFPRQPHVALWVREDWQRVKEDVMYKALYHKFDQYLELKEILLKTGDRKLVEHSPYDSYWGDGPDGKGLNRLGVLLMKLRDAYSGKHTSKIDQSGSNVQFDDTNKEQTETAENTPSPSNQTQSATSCTYANISENPNSEALITAPPNHLDNGQGSNQNPNGIKEIATSTTNEQQPSEQSPSCDPPNHLDNDQGVPISELDTSQGSSLTVPEPLRNDQNLNNFQNQQHPSTNQNPNNIEEIATNTTNEQQPSEQFPSNDPPDFLDKGQVVPTSEADSFQGSSSTVPGTLQNDHFLIDFQDQQHPSTNQNPNNIREIPTSTTNKQQQPSEQFPLYYDPNTHIIPTIGTTVPHSTDLDLQQQNQHYSNLGCDHLGSATNYSDIPQTGTGSDITCAEHCHVTQTTDRQSSEQSFSDREELPRGDDSSSERENGFAMDIDAPADPDEQMDTSENATQTCL